MKRPDFSRDGLKLYRGDSVELMEQLPASCIDTIVTDPPYHLTQASPNRPPRKAATGRPGHSDLKQGCFMGKTWDGGGVAFKTETWAAALRVAKPGAMLLAFGGTRTFHRLAVAIENGGWEIRDCLMWIYGSGFPKSRNISLAIDRAAGREPKTIRIQRTTRISWLKSRSKTGETIKQPSVDYRRT